MGEREDEALIVCGLNRLPELLLSAKLGPKDHKAPSPKGR